MHGRSLLRGRPRGRRATRALGLIVVGLFVAGSLASPEIGGVASAAPTPSAPPGGAAFDTRSAALTTELRTVAGTTGRVSTAGVDGTVTFVGGTGLRPLVPPSGDSPTDIARSFVDRYGPAFGLADARSELIAERTARSLAGGTAVRFRQVHGGVPVIAGGFSVQVAANGAVLSTSGEAAPTSDLQLDTSPALDAASAAAVARALVVRAEGLAPTDLVTSDPVLSIYEPALLGAPGPQAAQLVWHVDVRTPIGDVDRYVLVGATTGAIAMQFDQREDALSRTVCDNNNVQRASFDLASCPNGSLTVTRREGEAPTGQADVDDAYEFAGETYRFYMSHFGRDSVDGAGLPLRSTVRFCLSPASAPCPYANAFWNGEQMVYGATYASADDVVAHELTHGVTQYTSQLFYFAESGAINESMSDVMGELVDLQNGPDPAADRWKLGEDLPGGEIRSMSDPTLFGDPDRVSSPLFVTNVFDQGGVHINSGVNNKAAFLMTDGTDVSGFNGQVITGIGTNKTAAIYYEAESTILQPGSDFLDLYYGLQQACTNLLGTVGITQADCDSVRRAVTATEMNLTTSTGGVRVSAPVCPSGSARTGSLLSDDFEHGTTNWTTTFSGPGATNGFQLFAGSSQSLSHSFHGDDPNGTSLSSATTLVPVTIPATGTTFLRFDHAFAFDYDDHPNINTDVYYDGGIVGYSTTGPNGTFTDISGLAGLAPVNGYGHTLYTGSGTGTSTNLLRGRQAFSGVSPGYQTTRFDVSALTGQTVWFKFQIGSDDSLGADGWFIDDLAVYTCIPGATVPDAPTRVVATRGGAGIDVDWVAPASDGGSALSGYRVTPIADGVAEAPVVVGAVSTSFHDALPTPGRTYTFLVAAINAVGTSGDSAMSNPIAATAPVPPPPPPAPTGFVAVGPERVFDTRPGQPGGALRSVRTVPVDPSAVLDVAMAGLVAADGSEVTPVDGLGAVSMNVAVTNPAGAGFITVFPCADRKLVASVNFVGGQTVSNAVVAPVSATGEVCFFSSVAADLVVDINGWFPSGSAFTAVGPERVFDTRPGQPAPGLVAVPVAPVSPGATLQVHVAGLPDGATPASGVGAVSMNVAVTNPAAAGFVTVYPCVNRRLVASVNFVAGQTVSNAVVAPVSAGGDVCFFSSVPTDLVVDINGWFPSGSAFTAVGPERVFDTRPGQPGSVVRLVPATPAGPNNILDVQLSAMTSADGSVLTPATDVGAVSMNVAVTNPAAAGFVTVFPCGERKLVASVNFVAGQTVSNAVIAPVSAAGHVCFFSSVPTDLVVDINGWFPA